MGAISPDSSTARWTANSRLVRMATRTLPVNADRWNCSRWGAGNGNALKAIGTLLVATAEDPQRDPLRLRQLEEVLLRCIVIAVAWRPHAPNDLMLAQYALSAYHW